MCVMRERVDGVIEYEDVESFQEKRRRGRTLL